jgi:hypothetical protein
MHGDDAAAVVANGDHHLPFVAGRFFLGGRQQLLGVGERHGGLHSHYGRPLVCKSQ